MASIPDSAPRSRSPGLRRFTPRFRLRTLLLLVTVLCLWLTWQVIIARHQEAAVSVLGKYGGSVYYDFHDPPRRAQPAPWRAWLARWVGDGYVYRVVGVGLSGPSIDDPALATLAPHLARLRHLRWLDVDDVPITNSGYAPLGQLKQVEKLLIRTQGFRRPPVQLTDDGLAFLGEMENLRSLCINDALITGVGLTCLTSLRHLKSLDVRSTNFDDNGLSCIASLSGLTTLHVWQTRVTDVGMQFVGKLHHLEELYFMDCPLTDEGIARLRDLKELRLLDLTRSRISDNSIEVLLRLRKLGELRLYGTSVTDEGVAKLKVLPHLQIIAR